jgi:hypothetical protein
MDPQHPLDDEVTPEQFDAMLAGGDQVEIISGPSIPGLHIVSSPTWTRSTGSSKILSPSLSIMTPSGDLAATVL